MSKEEAESIEIELIAKYKSNDPKFGYNISAGGELGWLGLTHSEETKQKISKANTGKIRSEEFCKNMSKIHKGQILTEDWKHKLSVSRTGFKMSEEQKCKISKSHDKSKKIVYQYSKDNILINTWSCLCDIGKKLNIHIGSVSECCNGKRKTAGGYIWKYE